LQLQNNTKEVFGSLLKESRADGHIHPYSYTTGVLISILRQAPQGVRHYVLTEMQSHAEWLVANRADKAKGEA